MRNVMKNAAAGTVIGGSLLFAGMGIAAAQPNTPPVPEGLVNVTLGSAGVLEDVKAVDAAQIAAGVCDVDVEKVTALAETTVADGTEQMVCANNLGSILIQRTGPGQSESAPGHAAEAVPGQSGDEVPTVSSPAPATPQEPSTEHGR